MTDALSVHFKGRRAVLEPLFRALIHKQQRLGNIKVDSDKSFIIFSAPHPYAIVRVAEDHLEVFMKLSETTPIPPSLVSAARLRLPNMTHYCVIQSVSDITPDVLRSLMWAKEAS